MFGLTLLLLLAEAAPQPQTVPVRVATPLASPLGGAVAIRPGRAALRKGAPYALEAVTESVQTLADGNRIVSTLTRKQYRDSEGRLRFDNQMSGTGQWLTNDGTPQIVSITDPVARVHYVLDTKHATGTRAPILDSSPTPPGPAVLLGPGVKITGTRKLPDSYSKTEDLGKRVIVGVECHGERSTMTLPAGLMGNERAIVVTNEVWRSTELGLVILSIRNDPRSSVETYRVTRLERSEPPRSLFEVPPNYKIEEATDRNVVVEPVPAARKK